MLLLEPSASEIFNHVDILETTKNQVFSARRLGSARELDRIGPQCVHAKKLEAEKPGTVQITIE